jgi:hypothetical protein
VAVQGPQTLTGVVSRFKTPSAHFHSKTSKDLSKNGIYMHDAIPLQTGTCRKMAGVETC